MNSMIVTVPTWHFRDQKHASNGIKGHARNKVLGTFGKLPYYMKFSRHVNFAILRLVYFATLKFHDFSNILCFKSL